MIHLTLLFLAQTGGKPMEPGLGSFLIPFGLFMVMFYYLFIRPQKKKQEEHLTLMKSLKTGDKIVTSSGIHGLITNIKETIVTVKIADNVKIELERSHVEQVFKKQEEEQKT